MRRDGHFALAGGWPWNAPGPPARAPSSSAPPAVRDPDGRPTGHLIERTDSHGEGTEAFWPDPKAYTAAVHRQLHHAGVRTAAQAVGDAAVRHVLDTVEAPGKGGRLRHRIGHIGTVPGGLAARFAALGVIASM